ncbi:hypothetical protein NLM33_23235 [Bradyrhizobium sp. CCGUVB1N3]|uniref:hypothetical protein n=1 Tax=Bradyrhizobium sp. CCGUVB1N3 TaxID=2949629 RepID=UPI0020B1A420|nr:hypothetical protein [Bradyrhizobium sp. CCGUVB1N3]MCP3473230.1 hypothetical protein [Bradyrhizobium sp. CCGUVB1N3]
MSDKLPSAARFMVRQASQGWMVYDRQRKGPALIGTNLALAVNLTKEQAERIQRTLAAGLGPQAIIVSNRSDCLFVSR